MPLQLDDLAALDAPSPTSNGQPLLLPVDDIDEDPEQPRREFDANALQELAETIRQRGVRQAISVRPSLQGSGRWVLNFGARRLRASKLAGLTHDPGLRRRIRRQLRPGDRERAARGPEAAGAGAVRAEAPGARRQAGRHRQEPGQEPAMGDTGHRADRAAGLAAAGIPGRPLPGHERAVRTAPAAWPACRGCRELGGRAVGLDHARQDCRVARRAGRRGSR